MWPRPGDPAQLPDLDAAKLPGADQVVDPVAADTEQVRSLFDGQELGFVRAPAGAGGASGVFSFLALSGTASELLRLPWILISAASVIRTSSGLTRSIVIIAVIGPPGTGRRGQRRGEQPQAVSNRSLPRTGASRYIRPAAQVGTRRMFRSPSAILSG
jgi:hypothetical protein